MGESGQVLRAQQGRVGLLDKAVHGKGHVGAVGHARVVGLRDLHMGRRCTTGGRQCSGRAWRACQCAARHGVAWLVRAEGAAGHISGPTPEHWAQRCAARRRTSSPALIRRTARAYTNSLSWVRSVLACPRSAWLNMSNAGSRNCTAHGADAASQHWAARRLGAASEQRGRQTADLGRGWAAAAHEVHNSC